MDSQFSARLSSVALLVESDTSMSTSVGTTTAEGNDVRRYG